MNLRHRAFEQSLARRIRHALKASPSLRAEYRRVRAPLWRRHLSGNWLAVLVFIGLVAGAVGRLLEDGARGEAALAAIAFWFVGSAGASTRWIYGKLYDSPTVTVLYHLPLSDDDIFRTRWRAVWRAALAWAPVYLGVGAVLALQLGDRANGWPALLILPSAQYLLAVVMALHLAAWAPRQSRLCLVGYGCAAAVLFGWKDAPGWIEPMVVSAAWIPPFGWLNHGVARVLWHGDWLALALLLPIAALVAVTPISWRRLRAMYHLGEPDFAHGVSDDDTTTRHRELGPTELTEAVRAVASVAPETSLASAGWIERAVYRWWTPRERLVAGFFAGSDPGWSRSWRRMAWVFLAALATLLLFAQASGYVVVLAIAIPMLLGAPLLGGTWRGFSKRPAGGQFSPMYALYPIGFWEAFRVILKANCVRSALAAPFALALAAAAAWRVTGSVETGVAITAKVVALWLGVQPVVIAFRFAEATNDTQRLRLRFVLLLVPLVLPLLGGALAMFLAESLKVVAGGWLLAVALGLLLTHAYARGWAKGHFDLLCQSGDDTSDPSE